MLNKFPVITGLLVLISIVFFLRQDLYSATKLEWQKSKGARGYQVEITGADGRLLIKRETAQTYIEADLKPGSYKIRISPLNKFNKPEKRGPWTSLEVKVAVDPVLDTISKTVFQADGQSESIIITGSNLLPGCRVFLLSGDKKIQAETTGGTSDKITVTINPAGFNAGWYALELTNPGDRSVIINKKILITAQPSVKSVSADAFSALKDNAGITITGANFIEDCYLELKGTGGTHKITAVTSTSSTEISAKFSPSAAGAGSYELYVVNPGGLSGRLIGQVKITVQPVIESVSPGVFLKNQPKQNCAVTGKNFSTGAVVILKSPEKEILFVNVIIESGTSASFELNASVLPAGKYDLIFTNPGSDPAALNSAVVITLDPVINSVKTVKFRSDMQTAKLVVSGKNFIEGADVVLKKNKQEVFRSRAEVKSDSSSDAEITPLTLGEGSYELYFVNPGDRSFKFKKNISIVKTLLEDYRLFFGLSWGYNFILPAWRSILGDSLTGANIYAGYQLFSYPSNPVIRYIGAEAETGFWKYNNTVDEKKAMRSLSNIPFTLGMYAAFKLFEPVDIILRGGGGGVYTSADLVENGIDRNAWAVSLMCYGGLSARYQIYEMFFIEAGTDYNLYFFYKNPMQEIQPYIRLILAF